MIAYLDNVLWAKHDTKSTAFTMIFVKNHSQSFPLLKNSTVLKAFFQIKQLVLEEDVLPCLPTLSTYPLIRRNIKMGAVASLLLLYKLLHYLKRLQEVYTHSLSGYYLRFLLRLIVMLLQCPLSFAPSLP